MEGNRYVHAFQNIISLQSCQKFGFRNKSFIPDFVDPSKLEPARTRESLPGSRRLSEKKTQKWRRHWWSLATVINSRPKTPAKLHVCPTSRTKSCSCILWTIAIDMAIDKCGTEQSWDRTANEAGKAGVGQRWGRDSQPADSQQQSASVPCFLPPAHHTCCPRVAMAFLSMLKPTNPCIPSLDRTRLANSNEPSKLKGFLQYQFYWHKIEGLSASK